MNKIKKSCVAVGVLVVVTSGMAILLPSLSHGQGNRDENAPLRGLRRYYLTNTIHDGNEALTACAAGYHMASLWEIHDPTALRYDTVLGFNRADSGSGPPAGAFGWIRTGWDADEGSFNGSSNCSAWTSDSPFGEGTAVSLQRVFRINDGAAISPWNATGGLCFEPTRVWCVQN